MIHPKIDELVRQDPRFRHEAYEFVYSALAYTQTTLGLPTKPDPENPDNAHVTPQQLMLGIRNLALHEFGLMARTVFQMWGLHRSDDFADIVFTLIDAGLMSKTEQDHRCDFLGVFDFDELTSDYRIEIPVEAEENA